MNKLLEFGKRALFYVRVLSGYEERRIRNYRLHLEQRLQQAQERKEALRKIPEQFVLAEVRRMVEEMKSLNKTLEETEAAIEESFKPIDKQVEMIMNAQLEGKENTMEEMLKVMQTKALIEQYKAEKNAIANNADTNQSNQETESSGKQQAQMR